MRKTPENKMVIPRARELSEERARVLLSDPEYSKLNDAIVARSTGVTRSTVARLRRELLSATTPPRGRAKEPSEEA